MTSSKLLGARHPLNSSKHQKLTTLSHPLQKKPKLEEDQGMKQIGITQMAKMDKYVLNEIAREQ